MGNSKNFNTLQKYTGRSIYWTDLDTKINCAKSWVCGSNFGGRYDIFKNGPFFDPLLGGIRTKAVNIIITILQMEYMNDNGNNTI